MRIKDLPKHVGERVKVRGWVFRRRELKDKVFLVLRDSTGIVQCVVPSSLKGVEKARIESSVIVSGSLKKDERAPGGHEIAVEKLKVVGEAEVFPITKDQSVEFLLDVRHLWLRSRKLTAIMKVKDTALRAAREWFHKHGFWEVTPPIIVSGACEGGATLFKFKYFDRTAFLSQSAQLYLEALIYSLEKVYSLTPSFRAEKSRTRRHLAEYWHLEGEAAWVDHEENMRIQEQLVSYMVKKVVKERKEELESLGRDVKILKRVKPPFKRMTYDKAIEILQRRGMEIEWGEDLGADEERELTKDLRKPIFLTNYPRKIKAFYMKVDPRDENKVLNDDLLSPEGYGELIGGSQREDDLEKLKENMKLFKLRPKDYEWYLDLRRYGSVPHSGFGLGMERFVMWVCRLDHIRDTIPFPRVINRAYP
ncbi:asparagine--tRNA ligase [Nanoarchaeota archaeon]|nr:MAG: asparagine--tRNA ligase [Nanoarchaeota archaeon]